MPSFNALYELITPVVDEAEENVILRESLGELRDELYREMEDAFPNLLVSPGTDATGEQRLRNYMLKIVAAYPEDEQGRLTELYQLLDPDYLRAYKLGLLPAPLAHPWSVFIKVPWLFAKVQTDPSVSK